MINLPVSRRDAAYRVLNLFEGEEKAGEEAIWRWPQVSTRAGQFETRRDWGEGGEGGEGIE